MNQGDMFGPSLADARDEFFIGAGGSAGATCPCCDRFGKVYVRKFNSGMAQTLIYLYQHGRDDFVHLPSTAPRYILKDNQVGKLVFWSMSCPEPNKDDSKKNMSGSWKITDRGVSFIEGREKVWSHVIEYNHEILGFRENQKITIAEALGRPFNYRELMRDHPVGEVL